MHRALFLARDAQVHSAPSIFAAGPSLTEGTHLALRRPAMGKIRKWKPAATKPSSQNVKVAGLKVSLERRMQQRAERAAVQAAQRAVDETIKAEKRAEREEREVREKRKQENKEKGLQYQVISNTAKIKKMSKKQLRLIRKADTSGHVLPSGAALKR